MSTRCNIIIRMGDTVVYMYRHHDGYLAVTGADLLRLVKKAMKAPGHSQAAELLQLMLKQRYEKQSYEQKARPIYEITNGLHGDIEHVYEIDFEQVKGIAHAERPQGMDWNDVDSSVESWAAKRVTYSLCSFAIKVNNDRKATNRRIDEMKAKNPGNPLYQDIAHYPMVRA
jgi:hypothetical protein